MGIKRTAFQGVYNILRFNWHFYVIAFVILGGFAFFIKYLPEYLHAYFLIFCCTAIASIIISVLISYYVYDVSHLYEFNWLPNCNNQKVLNINAGFDETSDFLLDKYPNTILSICDFYDPKKHTEVSIKRAREAYPPNESSISVTTDKLPFDDQSFDICLATLAAHEIRNEHERIQFFKELHRVTKKDGKIFVTEHLRDLNNFLVYTAGFLHFHSKSTWHHTFDKSQLEVSEEIKTTPFISTFILTKNGTTS